jgi:hypothetical protein
MNFLPSIKMLPPYLLHLPKIRSKHHIKHTHHFFPPLLRAFSFSPSPLSLSPATVVILPEPNPKHPIEGTGVQPSPTPEIRPLQCTISLSSPMPVPLSNAPSLSSPATKKKNMVWSGQNFCFFKRTWLAKFV